MKLQTQIPLSKQENQIDYTSKLLLLGSCFVGNMGKMLDYFKFRQLQNPFGILFHPKAIENLVERALLKKGYTEQDFFFLNERWHCFDAHSELSTVSKGKLLQHLNGGLEKTQQQILKSSHMIITLGTAWVYRHKAKGTIVANCHKVSQNEFKKELLSVEQIVQSLETTINQVQSINKNVQFVFTVSPVRHLKDGFVENQQSKAHLIAALYKIIDAPPSGARALFPSYEIMMDELRDYRFYAEDMVHPNGLAIEYIWEKFKKVWISEKAYPVMEQVDVVQKAIRHRPFNEASEQHQRFRKSLNEKIAYLKKRHSFMEFGHLEPGG